MTTAVMKPGPGLRSKQRRDRLRILAFLSPWLIGVSVFFLYPLLSTVYFSFMKYDGFTPPTWTGLKNWSYVFNDYPSSGRPCATRCGW